VTTPGADFESTTARLVIRSPDFEHLPAVLTTREAAQALRIGVKEMRSLVDAGDVPAARFGPRRVIRIAKSALLGLLGRRRKARET
jgi:excisionase family DNA binding protein